jgi:hypothetical protein
MDNQGQTAVLDPEALEKSWDDSITALRAILGGGSEEPTDLNKARKQPPQDMGDEEEDESDEEEADEDEGDEEDEGFPPAKKSLPDRIAEANEDAEAAMDVAPFLKALADGLQDYIDESFDNLHKSLIKKIGKVTELNKALATAVVNGAQMQKSIRDVVYKIGRQPVPSGTILALNKSGQRPPTEEGTTDPASYDRGAVLKKSGELLREGKIDTIMATKIEGRVNKKLPLPEEVAALFETK